MRRIKKLTSNFLVCILCMTTFITQIHMVSAEETEDTPSEEVVQETTPETSEVQEVQDAAQTTENLDEYYKDGKILIYNYDQLKQIGSDAFVYTEDKDGNIGTGDIVVNEGAQLTYGKDAQYLLMNEIKMDTKSIWNVKDDFTGKIEGEAIKEEETPTLYDKKTDTIYIYNPYQLMVLEQEDSDKEPVMSLDYDAPQFGMGQMIYPNGEDKDYLTYSKDHNYVISKNFSSDKPELVADQLTQKASSGVQWLDGEKADGRTKPGQLYVDVNGKRYILIGNESQLRAIGSNKHVTPRLYVKYTPGLITALKGPEYIPYYPGDADLGLDAVAKESGTTHLKKPVSVKQDPYLYYEKNSKYKLADIDLNDNNIVKGLLDLVGGLLGILTAGTSVLCGVDENGLPNDEKASLTILQKEYQDLKYASNANYIIFRDIDLSKDGVNSNKEDDLWTPLMVSGDVIGAKLSDGQTQITDGTSILATGKPVISNVNVTQTGDIDVGKQMGVGFFGTVSDENSETEIGVSKGLVKVSNLKFNNIKVENQSTTTKYNQTLINGLVTGLTTVLGSLLDGLVWLGSFGSVDAGLRKTLTDVLDARKKDPTALATGTIVGRVDGNVEISNIEVENANVKNINKYTGGFAGYMSGKTQYDGLSKALGNTAKVLAGILNVIPGLGLGDLITILLGNAIPLAKLIPTGYINAKIVNCNINGLTISTTSDKEYVGGFIGMQKGSIVENCFVAGGANTISGKKYVGGFVGLARDDVIEGTLSGALDIQTELPKMNSESLLLNCSLNKAVVEVSGESHIGGFAGAMANTSAVNCDLTSNNLTVNASKDYAGGFTGIASLGWAADLGKADTKNNLLGGVVKLVEQLLSKKADVPPSLLSLAGVNPSHILGCTINAPLQVSGNDYVGGITGCGNGTYIDQGLTDTLVTC